MNGEMPDASREPSGSRARPAAAFLVRNGAWLIPLAAYALAWVLWMPLLGRDMGSAVGLPVDFLAFALAGNVMPGAAVLAWRLAGARVPPAARAGLPQPRRLPLLLLGALVLVPVMTMAGIGLQIAFGLRFEFGDVSSRLLVGTMWPLVAALGEEFAWRGTLLPLLRTKFGLLKAALLVGVVWGFWHLPADWIGLKPQGAWFWPQFVLQGPILLTAHSVIMAWIWAKTGGRTIAAVIYHFGITGSAIVLGNQAAGLPPQLSFAGNAVGAAVVACLAVAAGIDMRRWNRPRAGAARQVFDTP
jgi:membrane protease YdiL (CAAX protease family)